MQRLSISHPTSTQGEAFMAVTRWRPNQTIDLRQAFQQILENSFRDGLPDPDRITNGVFPVDIHETDDAIELDASIPGAEAADIEVSATENTVMIRAEVGDHMEEREGDVLRQERVTGVFQRSFTLPSEIDPNGVTAKFENGVLCVTLPKSEAQKPRRVQVQGQSNGQAAGKTGNGQQRLGQSQSGTTQPTSSQQTEAQRMPAQGQQPASQQTSQKTDAPKSDAQRSGSSSR
jgi:HSP20 family protein